jgi:hypothetical protein
MGGVPVDDRGPTVHGLRSYWLGGAQHVHADRELASAIEAEFPAVPGHVRAAEEFLLRVTRQLAQRGIDRYVRAGAVTWLPGGRNVHEAAREVIPGARVVYVSPRPGAHAWAQDLLADGNRVAAALAPVHRPAEVLAAPPVAALLAPGRPVAALLGQVLHFAGEREAAAQVAAWAGGLPPGSFLAISLWLPDDSAQAARLTEMFAPARVRRHTAADVEGWLEAARLEVVPPGVRDVRLLPGGAWAEGKLPPPRAPGVTAGALGRVPYRTARRRRAARPAANPAVQPAA